MNLFTCLNEINCSLEISLSFSLLSSGEVPGSPPVGLLLSSFGTVLLIGFSFFFGVVVAIEGVFGLPFGVVVLGVGLVVSPFGIGVVDWCFGVVVIIDCPFGVVVTGAVDCPFGVVVTGAVDCPFGVVVMIVLLV